jgi:putative methyltransferase (TIGR04325 family)
VNLKSVIRLFVPAAVYEAAHHVKVGIIGAPPKLLPQSFEPRASFEAAKREAGVGYGEAAMLADTVANTANITSMQDYAAPMLASVALATQLVEDRSMKIMDFGGGRGVFRAYVNNYYESGIEADWHVVETEEQVSLINQAPMPPGIIFSTQIGPDNYDLAIFCGSLHLTDDWKSVLRQTSADLIFIARSPLGDSELPYLQTVVRGENIDRFAGRVISKTEIDELLSATHELFASWDFEAHLLEMGRFEAPAMLWRRKSLP